MTTPTKHIIEINEATNKKAVKVAETFPISHAVKEHPCRFRSRSRFNKRNIMARLDADYSEQFHLFTQWFIYAVRDMRGSMAPIPRLKQSSIVCIHRQLSRVMATALACLMSLSKNMTNLSTSFNGQTNTVDTVCYWLYSKCSFYEKINSMKLFIFKKNETIGSIRRYGLPWKCIQYRKQFCQAHHQTDENTVYTHELQDCHI